MLAQLSTAGRPGPSAPPPGRSLGQLELDAGTSKSNNALLVFYFSDGLGGRGTTSLKQLAHSGMEIHFRRPLPLPPSWPVSEGGYFHKDELFLNVSCHCTGLPSAVTGPVI